MRNHQPVPKTRKRERPVSCWARCLNTAKAAGRGMRAGAGGKESKGVLDVCGSDRPAEWAGEGSRSDGLDVEGGCE